MPDIATYIQRVKSTKGHRGRKRKSQEQEPNFYEERTSNLEEALAKAMGRTPDEDQSDQPLNQAPLLAVHQTEDMSSGLERLEPTPIQELLVVGDNNLGLQESSVCVTIAKGPFEQERGRESSRSRGVQEAKGYESSPQSMSAVQQLFQTQGHGFLRGAPRSVHGDHPLGSEPTSGGFFSSIGAQQPTTDSLSQGANIFGGLGSFIGVGGANSFLPGSIQRRPSLPHNTLNQMEVQNQGRLGLEDQMHSHILQQLAQQNQMQNQQQVLSQPALLHNREQQVQLQLQQQQLHLDQLQRQMAHAFTPEAQFQLPAIPRDVSQSSDLTILRHQLLESAQDEARQEGKQNEGPHYESGGYSSFNQDP